MSEVQPIAAAHVRTAIASAAQATGVDFDYLLAQARLESGLDPRAQARTSSAAGLYQFISGTWLETLDRHGASHGLGWADAAITRTGQGALVADPAMRAQIMALRHDPQTASLMAAELARDNRASLVGMLGREPDHAELYLAHFLGAGGAGEFLAALRQDPAQPAAALFPAQAAANRGVFHDKGGRARSLGEVMDGLRARLEAAKDVGGGETYPSGPSASALAREFGDLAQNHGEARRISMGETLRAAFAGSSASAAAMPDGVRSAYGKLKGWGL